MAVQQQFPIIAYDAGGKITRLAPLPIVENRNPRTTDRAQDGQIWINHTTLVIYICAGIVSNATQWITYSASGSGVFTQVDVTTGDLTVDLGNVVVTAGDITASAGNIVATVGDVTAGGNVVATGILEGASALLGSTQILVGAGAPSNGLALATGDLYINTTAASTTTRLYIATGAGAWTHFTAAA